MQLWHDTFMCHQSEFKSIMNVYETLRKEGVIFPKREIRNKALIKFNGKTSPIFEAIEGETIYEVLFQFRIDLFFHLS